MKLPASVVNDAALEFVGPGATIKIVDGGMVYTSIDGSRTVRTGKKSKKGVYEANFETWDNDKVIKNYHVEID